MGDNACSLAFLKVEAARGGPSLNFRDGLDDVLHWSTEHSVIHVGWRAYILSLASNDVSHEERHGSGKTRVDKRVSLRHSVTSFKNTLFIRDGDGHCLTPKVLGGNGS